MADPILTLDVPAVPSMLVSTVVIEEVLVSVTTELTVPLLNSAGEDEGVLLEPLYGYVTTSYSTARSFADGTLKIAPTMIGRTSINNNSPAYWFQWGKNIVIEPAPDDRAEYQLLLHIADYPRRDLNYFYNTPLEIPEEFHPCIVDFACYVLSMKLNKWKQAAEFYNQYVNNLKKRKKIYIDRKAENRSLHSLLENK